MQAQDKELIKGSITGSSLMGSLERQPISKLINEEEKVSVNLYLSSSKHTSLIQKFG
jgi:hypothetical protein